MAVTKKSYIINNLQERLYTITLYFKKNENIDGFLEYLKTVIVEKDIAWFDNKCSFMSKESHAKLQEKYRPMFDGLLQSNNWSCFLNYKLSFKNFDTSITIFTIIDPHLNIDIANYIDLLHTHINETIQKIDDNIKKSFNIKQTTYNFLSYALINERKLLITIDKDLYYVLNIWFAKNKKMFGLTEQERNEKLTKDRFIYSYLFSFNFKNKEYLFKEFLNTCKICKNYHFDSNRKNCFPVCTQCGVIKEKDHICEPKTMFCGLCKLYYNKQLKHIPFDNKCLHKKNIQQEMFIKRRQSTLLDILSKPIKFKEENVKIEFDIAKVEFPILKHSKSEEISDDLSAGTK